MDRIKLKFTTYDLVIAHKTVSSEKETVAHYEDRELLYARHRAELFKSIISLNPHNQPCELVPILWMWQLKLRELRLSHGWSVAEPSLMLRTSVQIQQVQKCHQSEDGGIPRKLA